MALNPKHKDGKEMFGTWRLFQLLTRKVVKSVQVVLLRIIDSKPPFAAIVLLKLGFRMTRCLQVPRFNLNP